MMDQKKNDWLAALFFQPDKSVQELVNLGITPDNSNVKDREYYKGIPEIQEAFINDKLPKFRALQVYQWLHRGVESFDEMSNLSKELRVQL